MPTTVPNRPMNGALAPRVARKLNRRSSARLCATDSAAIASSACLAVVSRSLPSTPRNATSAAGWRRPVSSARASAKPPRWSPRTRSRRRARKVGTQGAQSEHPFDDDGHRCDAQDDEQPHHPLGSSAHHDEFGAFDDMHDVSSGRRCLRGACQPGAPDIAAGKPSPVASGGHLSGSVVRCWPALRGDRAASARAASAICRAARLRGCDHSARVPGRGVPRERALPPARPAHSTSDESLARSKSTRPRLATLRRARRPKTVARTAPWRDTA